MTLDTEALIRDVKSAFKNRKNSSSGRPDDAASSTLQSTSGASKSIVDAVLHREDGNRLHKGEKFREAMISYTKSVATAPEYSEELRKAYGNRSAALYELEEYEYCLLDVNRALKDCSDLTLKERLLDRKKRCLKRIKSLAGANDVSKIDEDGTNPVIYREPTWRADMLSKFGNPLLPNASPKIKLKHDEKWGRHFVATADIEPGEALIIEECFVAVTGKGKIHFLFCDFCLSECHALIPCPSCTSILYCSEQCKMMAYDQYHRMECKLLSVLPIEQDGSLFDTFAIRLFLVGTKQGAALENLMNNFSSVPDIFEENYNFADKPFTSDYMVALRLKVTSTYSQSISAKCIENAVEVITKLRKLAFFESVPDNRLEDDVDVFATVLLLNNCRRRYMNKLTMGDEFEEMDIWEGLLLLQNLMNHSCHPNIETFPWKRETIMCSVRPIKKDEQLFFCYYQNFECCSKPERILGHTGFICECEACTENWLPVPEIPLSSEALLVIKDGLLPKEEGSEPLFAKLLDISAPLLDDRALVNLEIREIVSIIAEIVSLLYKVMKPMSYPTTVLRFFLVQFIEYFYEDRERDLCLNGKLSFASSKDSLNLNDDELQSILPTDSDHKEATIKIYCVICRLNFYMENGRFVYIRNNIVG